MGYHLFAKQQPKSPVTEAVRMLRTNLQYAGFAGGISSVLITSARPGEGKTTIAANLAATYAAAGVQTIVVGVDLRKPAIHRMFDKDNGVGVTSVLAGQCSLDEALIETGVRGLLLLPAGPIPPNPSELLGSDAMRVLIAELERRADLIILDGPPVLAVADPALLARLVSGVIMVVDMRATDRDTARAARAQLAKVEARLLGVVANRALARGRDEVYAYDYYEEESDRANALNGLIGETNSWRSWISRLTGGRGGR